MVQRAGRGFSGVLCIIRLREFILDCGCVSIVVSARWTELRGCGSGVRGEWVVSGEEFVAGYKRRGGECGRGQGECESGAVTGGGGGACRVGGGDQDSVL